MPQFFTIAILCSFIQLLGEACKMVKEKIDQLSGTIIVTLAD